MEHNTVTAVAANRNEPINDKREIFGWAMYDWANSAFSTTVVVVFLGPYLTAITKDVSISGRSCGALTDCPRGTGRG